MGLSKVYVKLEDGSVLYGLLKEEINLCYDKLFEKESELDKAVSMFKRTKDIDKVSFRPTDSAMFSDPSLYNLVEAELYCNDNGGLIWYGEVNIEKNCLVGGRKLNKLNTKDNIVLDGDPDWIELTDDGYVRNVDDVGIYRFKRK